MTHRRKVSSEDRGDQCHTYPDNCWSNQGLIDPLAIRRFGGEDAATPIPENPGYAFFYLG